MTTAVGHPIFARLCVRTSPPAQADGAAELRHETLDRLTGRVPGLGAGNIRGGPVSAPHVVGMARKG